MANPSDEFGLDDEVYPAKPKKKAKKETLEEVLFRGLPHYRKEWKNELILDCYKIAADLDVSYQAFYKWLERNKFPGKRANQVIELSQKHVARGFVALTKNELWDFIS